MAQDKKVFYTPNKMTPNKDTLLKGIYGLTVAGGGAMGLMHMFKPAILKDVLGCRYTTTNLNYLWSDGYIGSTGLAFATTSAMALASGDLWSWSPILKLQGIYKSFWCLTFLKEVMRGRASFDLFGTIYFALYATFIALDAALFLT